MKRQGEVIVTPRTVALFVGKKGSGKSTRRKDVLAKAQQAGQRVLSFDVLDEDSVHGRKRASVELGALRQRMTTEELEDNLDILLEDRLSLAVVPVSREPEEWAKDFVALLEEVEEVGDLVLSADELAVWGQFCARALDKAACLSRHWGQEGVGLLLGSQRATGIPFTTRTQASDILSGSQDMPADLEALGDRCGQRFADEVAELAGHDFRHWRDTDGRWNRALPNKPGRTRKEKHT